MKSVQALCVSGRAEYGLCCILTSLYVIDNKGIYEKPVTFLASPISLAPVLLSKEKVSSLTLGKAESVVCWGIILNGFVYPESQ